MDSPLVSLRSVASVPFHSLLSDHCCRLKISSLSLHCLPEHSTLHRAVTLIILMFRFGCVILMLKNFPISLMPSKNVPTLQASSQSSSKPTANILFKLILTLFSYTNPAFLQKRTAIPWFCQYHEYVPNLTILFYLKCISTYFQMWLLSWHLLRSHLQAVPLKLLCLLW